MLLLPFFLVLLPRFVLRLPFFLVFPPRFVLLLLLLPDLLRLLPLQLVLDCGGHLLKRRNSPNPAARPALVFPARANAGAALIHPHPVHY